MIIITYFKIYVNINIGQSLCANSTKRRSNFCKYYNLIFISAYIITYGNNMLHINTTFYNGLKAFQSSIFPIFHF